MAKTKQLTEDERARIIMLNEQGMRQKDISNAVECTQSTVSYTIKKYTEHRTVCDMKRTGRKKIATDHQKNILIQLAKQKPYLSSTKLAVEWELACRVHASPRLIRAILQPWRFKRKQHYFVDESVCDGI